MKAIADETRQWLENVVIGLNLCPFATAPARQRRVRIEVREVADEAAVVDDLYREIRRLEKTSVKLLETTLLVLPNAFAEFEDFNQFLDPVDELLHRFCWQGEFQVASFHPHYRFAGVAADARSNFTNRSPYPILHILREASVSGVLDRYREPSSIPERNIRTLEALSVQQLKLLFPYL